MSTPNPKSTVPTNPAPLTPPATDPSPATPKSSKLTVSAWAKTRMEAVLQSLNDALKGVGFEISSKDFLDHLIKYHSEHTRYKMYADATGHQVTLKTSVEAVELNGTAVSRDFVSKKAASAGFPPNSWGVASEPAPKGTPPQSNRTTSKTDSKPVEPPAAEDPVVEKDAGQSKLEL